jgi:hypothetical protein
VLGAGTVEALGLVVLGVPLQALARTPMAVTTAIKPRNRCRGSLHFVLVVLIDARKCARAACEGRRCSWVLMQSTLEMRG